MEQLAPDLYDATLLLDGKAIVKLVVKVEE